MDRMLPVTPRHALIMPVPSLPQQSPEACQAQWGSRSQWSHTRCSPICSLPVEITHIIFSASYTSHNNSLVILSHVCRHFRAMVLSMPRRFWTKVDARVFSRAEAFIERAGGIPVDMTFSFDKAAPRRGLLSGFLTFFPTHHFHIRSLDMSLSYNDMQKAIEALANSFDQLEVLKLNMKDGLPIISPRTPLPLRVPANCRLRQVYLHHCSLNWSWTESQQRRTELQVLRLENITTYPCDPPPLSEFLDLLEASPNLRELAVVQAGPLISAEGRQYLNRTVTLPKLESLELSNPPEDVSRMLSHTIIPPSASVTCEYILPEWRREDGLDILLSRPSGLQMLPQVTEVMFTQWTNHMYFGIGAYKQKISSMLPHRDADPLIQLHYREDTGCMQSLSAFILPNMIAFFQRHSSVSTMHICWNFDDFNEDDWRMILDNAPNLTHLHLANRRDSRVDTECDNDGFFRALLSGDEDPNTPFGAPKLQNISLWGWNIDLELAASISGWLEKREERGLPVRLEVYHRSEKEGIRAEEWASCWHWQLPSKAPKPVILPQQDSAVVEQYYFTHLDNEVLYYDSE